MFIFCNSRTLTFSTQSYFGLLVRLACSSFGDVQSQLQGVLLHSVEEFIMEVFVIKFIPSLIAENYRYTKLIHLTKQPVA